MILVPFFASSTGYGSTKNLLSLPFQAPVFFVLLYAPQFVRDRFNIFIQFLKNGARNLASNEPNQS